MTHTQQLSTGITVGMPSDAPDWRKEIQRAPDDGTGNPDTDKAETIAVVPGTFRFFIDRLPKDGQRRHYRWRHVGGDYEPGPWSDWADDLPDDVPVETETGALERLEVK